MQLSTITEGDMVDQVSYANSSSKLRARHLDLIFSQFTLKVIVMHASFDPDGLCIKIQIFFYVTWTPCLDLSPFPCLPGFVKFLHVSCGSPEVHIIYRMLLHIVCRFI